MKTGRSSHRRPIEGIALCHRRIDGRISVVPADPVSLDLLRTFQAVYRAGTVTAAAATLGLSQPTVTTQLRRLEGLIGQPLFVRQPRGVVPTARAADLARRIADPLDALVGAAAGLGRSAELAGRTLHLGGPAEFVTALVLPALAGTTAVGIAVHTRLGLAADLLAELTAGRLELVVSTVPARRSGLHSEPLCDEEFLLVSAPAVAEMVDPGVLADNPTKALRSLPLVAYADDLPIVRRWWRHVLGAPPSGRAVVVVPDLRALLSATVAGIGATVLPRYVCRDDLAARRLVEVLPSSDLPINTLYLVANARSRYEPHVAHAWTALLEQGRLW